MIPRRENISKMNKTRCVPLPHQNMNSESVSPQNTCALAALLQFSITSSTKLELFYRKGVLIVTLDLRAASFSVTHRATYFELLAIIFRSHHDVYLKAMKSSAQISPTASHLNSLSEKTLKDQCWGIVEGQWKTIETMKKKNERCRAIWQFYFPCF